MHGYMLRFCIVRKAQERDYANAQKKTWNRVFGGKVEGYDEPDKEEACLAWACWHVSKKTSDRRHGICE
eukprot:3198738-Amphidinium_carterae.1